MCGIFGYVGPRDSAQICLDGLRHLEYRGYDSAGIAGIQDGKLLSFKEVGKLHILETSLKSEALSLDLAIAHTRWATHGKPTKENAHPHFDEHNRIAVVHNGIIENHNELRDGLLAKGVAFKSDTDSEVIAQLIAHHYEGDFSAAVQKTLSLLQGFWGLAIIHKDHPDQIIAAARENPIAIGYNLESKEAAVSSDANAFSSHDLHVLFLHNDEIAVIKAGEVDVYDQSTVKVHKTSERLQGTAHAISKNGFEHFMLKEIFEQPETIQQAFHGRVLEEEGTAIFDELQFTSKELLSVKRILILACGTSWHAGCIIASLLENIARIPTQAEIASEFRYKNPIVSEDTLVIAISQSGETLDTIAAVREVKTKGATSSSASATCAIPPSPARPTRAFSCAPAPRSASAPPKAFTSQLTVLSLFTLLMARLRNMSKEEGQEFLAELLRLPAC